MPALWEAGRLSSQPQRWPVLVRAGGQCPDDAVFLSGHTPSGQEVTKVLDPDRPIYARDGQSWRLVRLVAAPALEVAR